MTQSLHNWLVLLILFLFLKTEVLKGAVEKTTDFFTPKHDDEEKESPDVEPKIVEEDEKTPDIFGVEDSDISEQTTNFFGTQIGEKDEKTQEFLKHDDTVELKAPAEIISDFFATATSEADYVYLDNVPDEGIP